MGGVLGDITKIYFGSTEMAAVYDHTSQIWPSAYVGVLVANWVCAGQYTMATVPAGGGSASVTWQLQIYDTNGTLLTTVSVNPTVTISDTTNFAFSNGTWTANDRARNGITTASGTTQPTSAPARSCTLSASVSYTYNGVAVSGSANATMTQNANNVTIGTAQYVNFRFSIQNNKWTSANPGAASRNSATLSAAVDQQSNCTFDSGLAYVYNVDNAATTTDFSFSSESWITFSGATATMASRGTTYSSSQRSAVIYCTLHGSAMGNITVYQAQNVYINEQRDYSEAWAETYTLGDTIPSTATSFTVYGIFHFKSRSQYSSLEWGSWGWDYDDATPVVTSVTPSSGVVISGNVVNIPQNTGYGDIYYEVVASVTYDGQTKTGITTTVTQQGVERIVTFAIPVITDFYYPGEGGYNIPASGGIVYPVVTIEQDYYVNGVKAGTLHESIDDGTQSGTMGSGDTSSSFTIHYFVNNDASSNGGVSANSRGVTPGNTINIAANCYAYVTAANKDSAETSRRTVTQQYNQPESTEEFGQTYSVTDLGFEWESHSAKALSAGERGYLTWTSCKEYYYVRTWYTSGSPSDGTTQYNRDITADASESSSWLSAAGYYVTADKNGKNGTERSATVKAVYNGVELGSVTVTQAQTLSWYSLESPAESGLAFTAAGGSATVTLTGYHRYDNGDDPDVTVSPGVAVSHDGDVSGRISNGGTQGRTITATNLGSTLYDEVNTYYTYQWTLHDSATCVIPVVQGPNEPGDFGVVNFPDPGSTVDASGESIHLSPTCPFTWTSGTPGTMLSDGFDFEYVTKGNQNYRSYDFSGDYATFGSLGTNTRSLVNTIIRAKLKADPSKTDTAVIQEEPNGPTGNHVLDISWSNPVLIPGYGGSVNVGIVTAKYKTQYDSGDWDEGESLTPATIAASIQISGSGFTKTYVSGNSYVTISAPYNPDSSAARYCDVTAYYGGESDTTSVTQKKCPFATDYRETTESGQRIRTAYIINTDDEQHKYGYTKETAIGGVVDTVTGTTGTIIVGGEQNMGAVPLVSGQTNTISVVVDAVQYYPGGQWVSHPVIYP